MEDLLKLASVEQADELRLHVGGPPVLVLDGKCYKIGLSSIQEEHAERFLLSIANARQRRQLRAEGQMTFFYLSGWNERFLICARLERQSIGFDIV